MSEKEYLQDIKQVALKTRVWMLGSFFLGFGLLLSALLFNCPSSAYDVEIVALRAKELRASERLNVALKHLVFQQQQTMLEMAKKDSALRAEIRLNRIAIRDIDFKKLYKSYRESGELLKKTAQFERKK